MKASTSWLARAVARCGLLIGLLWVAGVAWGQGAAGAGNGELRIGSKRFTESYILAEILAQTAQHAGVKTQVRQGLGNTAIVYEALRSGQIDVYAEYTGTITQEIVKDPSKTAIGALDRALAPLGLGVGVPLGFNNGYALAMRAEQASALGITNLSDLAKHPDLKLGLSNEFMGRADGWRGLAERYGYRQTPRGLDHGLAYEALAQRQIDVMDIYTTDAQISKLGLVVLADDKGYFPRYDAVLLYRRDLPERLPEAWRALQQLEGSLSEETMVTLNGQATLQSQPFGQIAQGFLRFWLGSAAVGGAAAAPAPGGSDSVDAAAAGTFPIGDANRPVPMVIPPTDAPASAASAPGAGQAMPAPAAGEVDGALARFWKRLWAPDLWPLVGQHLLLVIVSVGLATLIAVPLGIALLAHPRARAIALGVAGVLQTIPSLALLAVLIALLGVIGKLPALIALTAYSVLPILSNTCAGLAEVPRGLRNAAAALGMTGPQRMAYVEFPLALPTVLAGIRTATAIAIGTATIAAFIGAGDLGERIVTGLALNDSALMLAGALPAAALALLSEALFEWLTRRVMARRQAPRSAVAEAATARPRKSRSASRSGGSAATSVGSSDSAKPATERGSRSRSGRGTTNPSDSSASDRESRRSDRPRSSSAPAPAAPSGPSALQSARPRFGQTVPQEAPMWLSEPDADAYDAARAQLDRARAERQRSSSADRAPSDRSSPDRAPRRERRPEDDGPPRSGR